MSATDRGRAWRPVLAGVIILALLVGVFSFAPSRALARQLLGIFRVRKFAVVQINPDQARMEEMGRALENKLFVGQPETLVDEPVVQVSSAEEASQRAGFTVRLPKLSPGMAEPQIGVKGRSEYSWPFTREGLVTLLELAEMDSSAVPAGFASGAVHVAVPAMVNISMGTYQIVEVRDPEITYPEGLDPRLIGQAGLRIMGLSPQEAQRISESVDWASTLVLPVPANIVEFREVSVGGAEGVFLRPRGGQHGEQATLLLEKDGILYMITGDSGADELMRIAESMF